MRSSLILVGVVAISGCEHFTVRTQSRIAVDGPVATRIDGPVETRVTAELPPVNPNAGRVRPVIVQPGTAGRVAILDVDGLLLNAPFVGPLSVGENPVALFREKLDAIEADPTVQAVVLRVNSPGGGVAACAAMRRDLERFKERTKLPVVACLLDLAAGGSYYLATASDLVIAGPATVTGGVGVILNLYNLKDLMAQYNVIPQLVKAGELADIGTSARPLLPAEKELLQVMANDFHKQIGTAVSRARPKLNAKEEPLEGRIFTGNQAITAGLVDRLGDLEDALHIAAQMACPTATGRPEVVLYRRNNDPAHSVYAVTANVPMQGAGMLPDLPGLDRAKMPTFLCVWQPELSLEKLGGK